MTNIEVDKSRVVEPVTREYLAGVELEDCLACHVGISKSRCSSEGWQKKEIDHLWVRTSLRSDLPTSEIFPGLIVEPTKNLSGKLTRIEVDISPHEELSIESFGDSLHYISGAEADSRIHYVRKKKGSLEVFVDGRANTTITIKESKDSTEYTEYTEYRIGAQKMIKVRKKDS